MKIPPTTQNGFRSLDRALSVPNQKQKFLLRLYVTGATARSARAILNIKSFCEKHLHDRYVLEVIDIYQNPALAKGDQIVAVPTLIKCLPAPLRRFIGDMSGTERILLGLDLQPRPHEHEHDRKTATR